MDIQSFRSEFSPYLTRALDSKLREYTQYTQDEFIWEMIHYLSQVIGGGKYIRPFMAYLMYQGLGGTDHKKVLDLLVSLEIFHAFALIHDDVIDKGDLRYNVSTLHTYIAKRLEDQSDNRFLLDINHQSNAQAILMGDLVLTWALARFQQFSTLPHHADAWQIFIQMIDEVAVGQMIDVDIMSRQKVSTELIETKMRLKTSGYTFVRPMQIGVALAGKSQDLRNFCQSFGEVLGLAFQTQDDILDIISDSRVIKKPVLTDIRDHQHTHLTQYVWEHGSKEDQRILRKFWGQSVMDQDQPEIQEIFRRTGALAYAQGKVSEYLSEARRLATEYSQVLGEGAESLKSLITYIEQRSR